MSRLTIVHWNDVYRVAPQKVSSNGDTIDVTQFAALLDDIRSTWRMRSDGTRDGLSLFSGDLFSPSVESAITRGTHMVPVMNELAPDVALTGNHDFDFGYPHLAKLVDDTRFPWLLSNVIDENTNNIPEHLHLFNILERSGVRVGIIGLFEEDCISLVSEWPPNFKYKDMAETGRDLSRRLRGKHQCDLIIALTHARVPNDIGLARDLFCLSPSAQKAHSIAGEHGVDIVLGGHDHFYFVTKGVTSWEGCDVSNQGIGPERDDNDILVVKSGTDFRELSELTLELEDTPPGSVRKKVIKAVCGKRHEVRPGMPSSKTMQKILDDLLPSISEVLKTPVCITKVDLDLRSHSLRTRETAEGNWFADALKHAYDDVLYAKYGSGADGVLICSGTLRGDSLYATGEITLGNILEILPFDDPVIVLELDGKSLWDAIEAAVCKYPAQEGSFPIMSGLRITWDSRCPPGQRVLGVWLMEKPSDGLGSDGGSSHTTAPARVDGEFIPREKNGRTYKIITREYMATGHCGYTALVGHRYLIDREQGKPMSTLVREYLAEALRVNQNVQSDVRGHDTDHPSIGITDVVGQETEHRARRYRLRCYEFVYGWQHAIGNLLQKIRSSAQGYLCVFRGQAGGFLYGEEKIGRDSHDKYDKGSSSLNTYKEDLLVIHPVVDGRLKDVARSEYPVTAK